MHYRLLATLSLAATLTHLVIFSDSTAAQDITKPENSVRFATYNVALNRDALGQLSKELEKGSSKKAQAIAEVIQRVRPDVLLINEIDYDDGKSVKLFAEKYLTVGQNDNEPLKYKHHYFAPVNTGVDSGMDLDGNKKLGQASDAFGFGQFPGKYGMAVLSNFEIDRDNIRTFQKFLWKDMPNAAVPRAPGAKENYYSDEIMEKFRLSSKSHWDVPIMIGETPIHFLACHPTPPVFDGPEDKNGCRNHDEIRMWADYVNGKGDYLYDDAGKKGGLKSGTRFVIAGDLNADPVDGATRPGAIDQLLKNDMVIGTTSPKSTGGVYWSDKQGKKNKDHKGDASCDTGDFSDGRVGNMRVDYVLPSKTLKVTNSGVFWPKPDEAGAESAKASDHRLVWIDIEK